MSLLAKLQRGKEYSGFRQMKSMQLVNTAKSISINQNIPVTETLNETRLKNAISTYGGAKSSYTRASGVTNR